MTGGKGDVLMGEREIGNMLPGDTTSGQKATEGSDARDTLK